MVDDASLSNSGKSVRLAVDPGVFGSVSTGNLECWLKVYCQLTPCL